MKTRRIQINKTLIAVQLAAGVALQGVGCVAAAAFVDLAPALTPFTVNNVGDSRSVVLRDDSSSSISSFGVRMDPLISAFNLTAEVFSFNLMTGTRGALIGTATQAFTDLGLGFYDVSLSQNLIAGQAYELNLKAFGFGNFNVELYNFNGPPGGGSTPFAAGPVTVFDGCGDGNVGGCGNTILAHFRINAGPASTVPEPMSPALLGIGVAAAGMARRRKP